MSECGRKFDVLPELIGQWEQQYEADELKAQAGRRSVRPKQAEITRLRAELPRCMIGVPVVMALVHPEKVTAYLAKDIL